MRFVPINHGHRHRLLRTRRERPGDSCAAEQRDELASAYVKHGNFLPCSDAGVRRLHLRLGVHLPQP
jgi:hypothetical protein